MQFFDYLIIFMDGIEEKIEYATRHEIEDGVLTIMKKETSYGPWVKHLGSYPLCNIRKWHVSRR